MWSNRFRTVAPTAVGTRNGFDERFGVVTSGYEADPELSGEGVPYARTPELVFEEAMRAVAADLRGFTFVDIGAGKGLALLLASRYPFQRIVGVEFSKPLVETALANFRAFKDQAQRCSDLSCVCADALFYVLPEEPLVLYLFNPFQGSLMRGMARKVAERLRGRPEDIWLIYVNPVEHRMFDEIPELQRVSCSIDAAIYRRRSD